MSRAGKFIPGGAQRKTSPVAPPIRGPEPPGGAPAASNGAPKKKLGGGINRPVPKSQRLPILGMSSFVCCMLVSIAWYQFGVIPAHRALAAEQAKAAAAQKQLADEQQAEKEAALKAAEATAASFAVVTVNSNPPGVVTIGEVTKPTPATFDKVPVGKATVAITADGYNDYRQEITTTAGKPVDLGTIALVQSTGTVTLTSPQSDVGYTITGPNNYSHSGQLPDKLADLPVGTYELAVHQADWALPQIPIVIHGQETLQKEIKFPYGSLTLTSLPSGATVRNGNIVLGQTPLNLSQLRPGTMNVSIDLPPYNIQRVQLDVPDAGNVSKQVVLEKDKDFISASGMPMVWIPDGFWAGKYLVTQRVFEEIANFNPSDSSKPNHPVETVTWEQAHAFCERLNEYEQRAGKLPRGYHYALPTEAQWETFSADADINLAATSRVNTLSSPQDVGASEANKYGLYDTIGNVWEWCSDATDDKGSHSMRGGNWLSSSANFPTADTRAIGAAKYGDRFTGFRVVLIPNS